MRAVVQRVSSAAVSVEYPEGAKKTGSAERGLLIYLGVGRGDEEADADYLAEKIAHLRIFMDSEEKMNLSLLDMGEGYGALVVSQFTLFADARKGRRPSYSDAADNDTALRLYEYFCRSLAARGIKVETGRFREIMRVAYVNEGPITILLDSKKIF